MKTLATVKDVIKELGGRQAVADLAGVKVKAVAIWRWQNALPAKSYLVLRDALEKRGCKADTSLFSFTPISDDQPEAAE